MIGSSLNDNRVFKEAHCLQGFLNPRPGNQGSVIKVGHDMGEKDEDVDEQRC